MLCTKEMIKDKEFVADGYKIFNYDWTGFNNYSYKNERGKVEGVIHYLNPPMVLCRNGFHFSENVLDCLEYYDVVPWNRFAKVRGYGSSTRGNDKKVIAVEVLEITEILTFEEFIEEIKIYMKKILTGENSIRISAGLRNNYKADNGADITNDAGIKNATDIRNGAGIINGSGIRNGYGINDGYGIRGGSGIIASSGINIGYGIKNGSGIRNGSGISDGKGILNGVGIRNGHGISDGYGIRDGSGICTGFGIAAGYGIRNGHGIRNGSGMSNCSGISKGSGISDGYGICEGHGIRDGAGIRNGSGIRNGNGIRNGYGIRDGSGIRDGYGIRDGTGISNSSGIRDGHGIRNGYGIREGYGIERSNGVSNSMFCKDCEGISRCIFCIDYTGKLAVFNTPVEETRFNEIWHKIRSFDWRPDFTNAGLLKGDKDWRETPASAICGVDSRAVYKNMPEGIIEYVKSLPEFDEQIFTKITNRNLSRKP